MRSLFQIQEEEEDNTEEKENEDPEDGYREKKEKNKSDCTTLRDDLSVGSIVYLSFWHVTAIYCTASRPNKEFCLLIQHQHAHILIQLRNLNINLSDNNGMVKNMLPMGGQFKSGRSERLDVTG